MTLLLPHYAESDSSALPPSPPLNAIEFVKGLFLVTLRWNEFSYLYHNYSHDCCVSHCDENTHFVTSFFWFFISMTFAVLLSDINIAQPHINEKLIVMMIDINFLNI